MLGIIGKNAQTKLRSGAKDIERNLTSGKQTYDTDKSEWPLSEPIIKLEAVPQCSGSFKPALIKLCVFFNGFGNMCR